MAPEYGNFVGRERELNAFRRVLKNPYGKIRILFILGDGGTGKTLLVKEMLREARKSGALAAEEPIDLFSTDYRHIDGIQWKIKEIIENLPGLVGKPNPFADFVKGKTDTSEKFYECLKEFCATHSLVLAFDTFENLDKVASNWLFNSEKGGLQMPGLSCIIAGRYEKDDLEKYRKNPLVKEIPISGFTLEEAEEFFRKIADEFVDPLGDFLRATGIEQVNSIQKGIEWIWKVTEGHPLRLEMAFRWSGTLLGEKSLTNLTADKFEKRLMAKVLELAETGQLDIGPGKKVSRPVYDTLICMAFVTRRFGQHFLKYLIDKKLIHLEEPNVSENDILENLEKYFFVKVRSGSGIEQIIQLHDEMARLVRVYVWPFVDKSVQKKHALLMAVDQYYDQLISEHTGEEADILRVEKLYYVLQRDWKEEGKRLWFKLAELDNDNINKFLPGEIKDYIKYYDAKTKFQIYIELGRMERNAHHVNQALGYFGEARKIAENELPPSDLVEALFGISSCKEPDKALKLCKEAKAICEEKVPEKLPNAYYNIGFTYRRMQNIKMAISWYRKAKDQFRKNPWDKGWQAKIENDLGYAYSFIGEWEECRKIIDEGLKIRKYILSEHEKAIEQTQTELSSVKDEKEKEVLLDRLNSQELKRSKATFDLGLSYSTSGEIYRYQNELDNAMRSYEEAYHLFVEVESEDWQARTLYSRGETERRFAQSHSLVDGERQRHLEKARQDIKESLYLCERYRLESRDTANRRMGRLLHDLALDALERSDKPAAQAYLDDASSYFVKGLKHARDDGDVLEELENLTELAFIVNDFMIIANPKNIPQKYQESLDNFKNALDKHRKDKFRIYQFPVFENLYKLEKGATYYQSGKYREALKAYLEANIGLATNPGYGQARYKQHFSHLTRQIENLKPSEAAKWCRAFIQAWETTPASGKRGRMLAQEILPDLVVWCNRHLKKIGQQKV